MPVLISKLNRIEDDVCKRDCAGIQVAFWKDLFLLIEMQQYCINLEQVNIEKVSVACRLFLLVLLSDSYVLSL